MKNKNIILLFRACVGIALIVHGAACSAFAEEELTPTATHSGGTTTITYGEVERRFGTERGYGEHTFTMRINFPGRAVPGTAAAVISAVSIGNSILSYISDTRAQRVAIENQSRVDAVHGAVDAATNSIGVAQAGYGNAGSAVIARYGALDTSFGHLARTSLALAPETNFSSGTGTFIALPPFASNNGARPEVRIGDHGQSNNSEPDYDRCVQSQGAPVNVGSGAMWHKFTDFTMKGRSAETAIVWSRTYMTVSARTSGDFGPHWHHGYETRLLSESSANKNILWLDEAGGLKRFTYDDATQAFTNPAGFLGSLGLVSDHYELKKTGGMTYFFAYGNGGAAPAGALVKMRDRHGQEITFTYSGGALAQIATGLAGTVSITRDSSGRISAVTRDRDGLTYSYSYDSEGRLATSADFENYVTTYRYTSNRPGTKAQGLLASFTDPLQRVTSFTYYDNGQAHEQREPGNAYRAFSYVSSSGIPTTRLQEIDGATTEFRLTALGQVAEVVYADGGRVQRVWDAHDRITARIDEQGHRTDYRFDARGNVSGVKRAEDSAFTQMGYDSSFDQATSYQPLAGGALSMSIDPSTGDVTSVTRGSGGTALSLSLSYDAFGNIVGVNNGRGSYGNATNSDGLVTAVFDARNPESRGYDARGRVSMRRWSSGRSMHYVYDNFDRVTSIVDSHGPDVVLTYDVMGRMLMRAVTDGSSTHTTAYAWDDRDRLVRVTDALGRATDIQYDRVAMGCDVVDKPTRIIDPAGRITAMEYDSRQRLTHMTDAKGQVTQYEYNLRGDLTALTDAENHRSQFFYDGNGRLVRQERPSSAGNGTVVTEITRYSFDGADRLTKQEKTSTAAGAATAVTEMSYDSFDRMVGRTLKSVAADGTVTVQDTSHFSYEPQLDTALRTQANNDVANLGFTYEAVPPFALTAFSQRAAQAGNPWGIPQGTFAVSRDVTGQIGGINWDGIDLYSAQYDAAARLMRVLSGYASQNLELNIGFDGFGRRTSQTSSTGLSGSWAWDALSRAISTNWSGSDGAVAQSITAALVYDVAGNVTSIAREMGTFTFGHDQADQLTSVNGPASLGNLIDNRSWSFDGAGNRTNDSALGAGASINNVITQLGGRRYETDDVGNVTRIWGDQNSIGDSHFTMRPDGKVTAFSRSIGSGGGAVNTLATYAFDALGRRVAKSVTTNGVIVNQAYAFLGDEDKVLLGKKGNGVVQLFIAGAGSDEHLGQIDVGGVRVYVTDHLGSILNSIAAGTNRVYAPFGELLGTPPSITASSDAVMYGWQGLSFDAASGLYENGPRMYNQTTGRFLQTDPIGFAGHTMNLYESRFNNPLRYTDPSGLDVFFVSFGGNYGISGSSGSAQGGAGSFGTGIGYDTNGSGFFGFTTSGSGTTVGGAFAGGGVTGGYFPGTQGQFFGPGTEQNVSFGVGEFGGGFSRIQSSGVTGYAASIYGFGVGASASNIQTQTNPAKGFSQACGGR